MISETIQKALNEAQIANAVYYPVPLHKQNVFAEFCKNVKLPVTEQISAQCMSLPIYPEMTSAQVDEVLSVIAKAVEA